MNQERIIARVRLPPALLSCVIGAAVYALPPIAADALDASEHEGSCRAGCRGRRS